MTTKTIQLSTRVTDEDATFLARLQIEGATTPSDKIRALIGEARRRHEGTRDYRSALRLVTELLAPVQQARQSVERETGKHSELVRVLEDRLKETLAFWMSELPALEGKREERSRSLHALEQGLADRAFTLVEAVLRLAVTPEAPCYDRGVVADRVSPALSLLEVIQAARHRSRGEKVNPQGREDRQS